MLIGAAHLTILFRFEEIKIILAANLSTLLLKVMMLPYEVYITIYPGSSVSRRDMIIFLVDKTKNLSRFICRLNLIII